MTRSKVRRAAGAAATSKAKVRFQMKLGAEAVTLSLQIPTTRVTARRMLPVFQAVTHRLLDLAVAEAAKRGEAVSCKAGCGACCRQMVSISLTEARQLAALVAAMPEPKRSQVRARFADATARLEAAGMLDEIRKLDEMPSEWHEAVPARYFALGIACPLLEDESCSIHPDRPLLCREYLVTSSAEHCADARSEKIARIPLPGHVSTDVVRLEDRGPTASRVALVLALEWAAEHATDEPGPRPAIEWLEQVLGSGAGGSAGQP